MKRFWSSLRIRVCAFFAPFSVKAGWSQPHKAFMYAITVVLVVLLILSFTVLKTERVIEKTTVETAPAVTETSESSDLADLVVKLAADNEDLKSENSELTAENSALEAENSGLEEENTKLGSSNSALSAANTDLEAENTALKEENAELSGQLPDTPAPPSIAILSWTDTQAKFLMRTLYPGDDKYRDPAFDEGLVYPISWYKGIASSVSDISEVGDWIAWFSGRYPGIITGYAWMDYGGWHRVKLVLAEDDTGGVNIYYFLNGKFVAANSDGDTVTPYVKAINLVR